jgi:hypothetical protein
MSFAEWTQPPSDQARRQHSDIPSLKSPSAARPANIGPAIFLSTEPDKYADLFQVFVIASNRLYRTLSPKHGHIRVGLAVSGTGVSRPCVGEFGDTRLAPVTWLSAIFRTMMSPGVSLTISDSGDVHRNPGRRLTGLDRSVTKFVTLVGCFGLF